MKKREDTKPPEVQSLDEEKEYWEARGPLAEGHKGRVNKPKPGQRRSSFLAVRLTGEELTRLRDIAARQGVGPSTFARLVLTAAIEHQGKLTKAVTLDELGRLIESRLSQPAKDKLEALVKSAAIGDPSDPFFMLMDVSQTKQAAEIFIALLSAVGVSVIAPEDKGYKEVRDIVEAQT
ncbi:MAG: hypothetical protein HYY00_05170 [Chloroflexi bacterium]|nr:hypothetical protein [Chloroflexota bacterium]